eukprot:9197263-Pyramimonas_sp.AAC.1
MSSAYHLRSEFSSARTLLSPIPEGAQQSSQRCQSWTYARFTRPCPERRENCRGCRWRRRLQLETARAPFILCGASGRGAYSAQ